MKTRIPQLRKQHKLSQEELALAVGISSIEGVGDHKKKLNWRLILGLVILSSLLIIKQFADLPDFICGFGYGLSISLEVYGILLMNRDMDKARRFKRNLIGLKEE